ncbi:MAG TPA: YdeI/OmpD-associated family protein [Candidatus Eremiobacteraceae bacterium]|nr:YdeI/OmpD-associated family protein [Candidatus Eremiobacteraceae bacterium]
MIKVPADLRKALAAAPASKALWGDLTPIARMDFVSWIEAAKQPETRRRRIERACDMLEKGKRRPCCYSIVPLDFHNALAAAPTAKAAWGGLTSTARRDLLRSIEAGKQPDKRKSRIEKVCLQLATRKRRP